MKRLAILSLIILVSCGGNSQYVVTCHDIDKCYDSASSKCRGSWTQIRAQGQPYPYTERNGDEYRMKVLCRSRP